jgi:hypothetical protein
MWHSHLPRWVFAAEAQNRQSPQTICLPWRLIPCKKTLAMTGKHNSSPRFFGAIHDTVMHGGNNRFCKGNFFDGDTLHKVEI